MLTVTFFFGQFVLFRAQNYGKITPPQRLSKIASFFNSTY